MLKMLCLPRHVYRNLVPPWAVGWAAVSFSCGALGCAALSQTTAGSFSICGLRGGSTPILVSDLLEADEHGITMKSLVVKRSVVIGGHKTSVSLEDAFWTGLKQIASSRKLGLSEMVAMIDAERSCGNLSSAIRLFVLEQFCRMIEVRGRGSQPLPTTQIQSGSTFRS